MATKASDKVKDGEIVFNTELTPEEKRLEALKAKILDREGGGRAMIFQTVLGKRTKIGELKADQVLANSDIIAREFGGGDYSVDFTKQDGDFISRYHEYSFHPRFYGPTKTGPDAAGVPATGESLAISIMRENKTELVGILKELISSRGPAVSAQEQLNQAMMLFEKFKSANPAAAADDNKQRIYDAIMAAGIAAMKKGGGDSGGIESMSAFEAMALELFKGVSPAIGAIMAKKAGIDVHRSEPEKPALTQGEDKMATDENFAAAFVAPKLLELAQKGITPDQGMQEIYAKVDQKYDAMLDKLVSKADTAVFMAQFCPGISAHAAWVNEVAKLIKADMNKSVPPAAAP